MSELLSISKVRRQRLLSEIRKALWADLDVDRLSNFMAGIDWSGAGKSRPKIADDLGAVEAWTTQFTEGFISRDQLIARLLTMLPERERNWRLFLADRPTVITVVHWAGLPARPQPVLERSGVEHQNQFDVPAPMVPSARNSDIVLVA